MSKTYIFNDLSYDLISNYKEGFVEEEVFSKLTDYFNSFDYVVGDWAYGKLRLKGFYNKDNKSCKKYNNIERLDNYIKKQCAYECKYFVLKKNKEEINKK